MRSSRRKPVADAVPPLANASGPRANRPSGGRAGIKSRKHSAGGRPRGRRAAWTKARMLRRRRPVARVRPGLAAHASREWSGQAAGGLPSDSCASAAPSVAQTTSVWRVAVGAFRRQGHRFQIDESTPSDGTDRVYATRNHLGPGSAPSDAAGQGDRLDLRPAASRMSR